MRSVLLSVVAVCVLFGTYAGASTKKLDYYNRVANFENSHDVCGGTATLVFEGSRAILRTDFTQCSYLTLRKDGVVWRQSLIDHEYLLDLNRVYVGLFTVSLAGIAGDKVEVDTRVPVVLPPPPQPPPAMGPNYKVIEISPNRGGVIIPDCGGQVFVRATPYNVEVVFEGVGRCHHVQVKNLRHENLSGFTSLEGGNYNYFGKFNVSRWNRREVVYELTSKNGGFGADIVVRTY
jgi:hypothetical protein